MRIPFPFIAYTHDDLCRKIRDYIQSFGKGCRIIRRAEFLEEIRYYADTGLSSGSDESVVIGGVLGSLLVIAIVIIVVLIIILLILKINQSKPIS